MRPVAAMGRDEARGLRGLAFDLDDTLLSHGTLTREAYGALWDLADAGLRLFVVTGRPSSWGEIVARQWPVEAAITENGAVVVRRSGRGIERRQECDDAERRRRRMRLASLVEDARARVPEAGLTDDVGGRESDVTWDVGERVRLPEERVAELVACIRAAGARWTRSSIHVHATYDGDDKASGTVGFLATTGVDEAEALGRFAFVGDSGNDAACFAAFRTTVGVANVAPYVRRLSVPPRYVTTGEMGRGFAELSRVILEHRAGRPRTD